jgi:hypothetical protein
MSVSKERKKGMVRKETAVNYWKNERKEIRNESE